MIGLHGVPNSEWQKEYDKVIKDSYIVKKYNRSKRLKEKQLYIDMYLPELKYNDFVVDLGPGPGEFMEVCREKGCHVIGIDAKIGDSEMGDEYLELSRLMVERQNLNVQYMGAENLCNFPFNSNSVSVINAQGSIEQIFKKHLIGVPHKKHKDCRKLSWSLDANMKETFEHFFKECHRVLKEKGILLVYGNGSKNTKDYNLFIKDIVENLGLFKIVLEESDRLHKMEKK
jgi:SAM-dependent methyltransferase